jgi:predicted phosphodiesterase
MPAPDRIAIISDVHGNVTALEAVLADIAARGIGRIVNLGDVVAKGPRSAEAVQICREACEVTVRGNWDSFISGAEMPPVPAAVWTRDQLSMADLGWLAALPNTLDLVMSGKRIRLFHASQVSELHRVRVRHTPEEFAGMFTNTAFTGSFRAGGVDDHEAVPDVVGYGDIHDSFMKVADGKMLFNVGATGNPLDAPTAPYAVLEGVAGSTEPAPFSVQFSRVPYDIDAELAVATRMDMPQTEAYGRELREGIYRGRGNG